jgi:hypothetical protein
MPDKTYPRPPILPYHPPRPIPRKGREPVAPFVGIACERPTFGKPDIGGAAPARVAEAQPRSRAAPGLRPGLLRTPARSLLTVREVPDESAARRRNENAADGAPEGARVARSSLRSSRQQRARRCGTLKDRCALRCSVLPFPFMERAKAPRSGAKSWAHPAPSQQHGRSRAPYLHCPRESGEPNLMTPAMAPHRLGGDRHL